MITFLKNEKGLVHCETREPNCWINVTEPTEDEKRYLIQDLKIPEAYYNDIEDVDERPRIEIDEGWYLVLMRIPYKSDNIKIPFSTVPLGIIFKNDIYVSICLL